MSKLAMSLKLWIRKDLASVSVRHQHWWMEGSICAHMITLWLSGNDSFRKTYGMESESVAEYEVPQVMSYTKTMAPTKVKAE